MLQLGSPAKLSNKPFNVQQPQPAAFAPFQQGLSSPFAPQAAHFATYSPKGLFGSPLNLNASGPQKTPPSNNKVALSTNNNATPDCPPPVLLGADSCPRFPTPQYRDTPIAFPRPGPLSPLLPQDESPDQRGRPAEKSSRSIMGRLRSKSRSGKDKSALEEGKAPSRERRFSLSDKLSAVLKRKSNKEQETPPPLPSRVKTSASSTKLAVQLPPRTLARSASSPNLSRKQSWREDTTLPPLPVFDRSLAFELQMRSPDLSTFQPTFTTPPMRASIERERSDSPTSMPSLSPTSSQSVSLFSNSSANLHTPNATSPSGFPCSPVMTPEREVLEPYFPSFTPAGSDSAARPAEETTPLMQTLAGDLAAYRLSPLKSGASDDIPLALLHAQKERAGPFQFVPAEMSKKPLKKGRSTPDLRQPFRRPPSVPGVPFLGHSLLPQTDDKLRRPAEPLPLFVQQSVLAMNT